MKIASAARCKKRVSVVGLGRIGLPTALLAAKSGFTVTGFDSRFIGQLFSNGLTNK